MSIEAFVKDPLQGKTSLSRVFWLYGILGSLLYGSLELFLSPENQFIMRLYTVVGFIYSVYVSIGIYRCAGNSRSRFAAQSARIGAIATLILLPILTYLDMTGSLNVADLLGGELPE